MITRPHAIVAARQNGSAAARVSHSCHLLLLAMLAIEAPSGPPARESLAIEVTSVGCDVDDAELERLLVLELGDLPQTKRGFALHVELRCELNEIGILVWEPDRGTSLRRTLESPEAAVGRERVLALAIRQLVDTSFIDLVTDAEPRVEPSDSQHAPEQASQRDPRAPAADGDDTEPAHEPAPATPDLVAGGGAAATQGSTFAPADQARVDLGLELGALGRTLERDPRVAARFALRTEVSLGPRWSVLGLIASDWTTLAATGGRVHALDLSGGVGTRARFALPGGVFALVVGGDLELGWGRVLAVAEPGFDARRIDGVVVEGRLVGGVWAHGQRSALGIELAIGGGPRSPVGVIVDGGELSLGGLFVGALIGGSFRVR